MYVCIVLFFCIMLPAAAPAGSPFLSLPLSLPLSPYSGFFIFKSPSRVVVPVVCTRRSACGSSGREGKRSIARQTPGVPDVRGERCSSSFDLFFPR